MDRHGGDGPSILVETDGAMRIIDVLRFGPTVTELGDQQRIWDDVAGKIAPTMKPFIAENETNEEGVEVLDDLEHGDAAGTTRRGRSKGNRGGAGGGQSSRGKKRTGGRGRG
ncbi:MAG: hypothetical protein HKN94_04610 [Acidimicrobiales bacterium]|nr:hypothetical protein [Acidimicrobiales bacterium]